MLASHLFRTFIVHTPDCESSQAWVLVRKKDIMDTARRQLAEAIGEDFERAQFAVEQQLARTLPGMRTLKMQVRLIRAHRCTTISSLRGGGIRIDARTSGIKTQKINRIELKKFFSKLSKNA